MISCEKTEGPGTIARMSGRGWFAAAALFCSTLTACNALRETRECSVNLDCPRGTTCSADEGYCRSGAPITIGYLAASTGPQGPITQERRVALDFGRWVIERDPARKVLGRGL